MISVQVSGLELWCWQQDAKQKAIAANIPVSEVDWLLQEIAGLDRLSLRLESFQTRSNIPLKLSLEALTQLWQQRTDARVPLQYLVGVAPWRQFLLAVSPAVLIPRPETECLIDLAVIATQLGSPGLAQPDLKRGDWADLGTGSGAIALGLAAAFPDAAIHAVDYSADALAIAQQNAQRYNMGDRIRFYQGSWFTPLTHLKARLSGMVSNPPYIPNTIIPDLQPEVANHEPYLALNGGNDGLDCIRDLVATAPDYLISGGIWLIEMMAGQAEATMQLLQESGKYRDIRIHADLAGIDRFASAYRL
ncbi:MAG: peptide chain release factor N(5)-glutamine methyltransferase [Elainellaceae cyanobacterium]